MAGLLESRLQFGQFFRALTGLLMLSHAFEVFSAQRFPLDPKGQTFDGREILAGHGFQISSTLTDLSGILRILKALVVCGTRTANVLLFSVP